MVSLPVSLILGIGLRLCCFGFSLEEYFKNSIEFVTPTTSYKRILEALYLYEKGVSPYDGSIFIQPPLILLPFFLIQKFSLNQEMTLLLVKFMYILIEILIAYLLYQIGNQVSKTSQKSFPLGPTMASAYLLNPIMILSCTSLSTILFHILFIVSMIYFALNGNIVMSNVMLAFASYLTVHPIYLFIPLVWLLKQRGNYHSIFAPFFVSLFIFVGTATALFYISFRLNFDSISFVEKSFIYPLTVGDLTPNWGNAWYFFTEVFDQFRPFFYFVFNLHVIFYLLPLFWKFKQDPLFILLFMIGVISIFKPYPTLADFFLYKTLFLCYYDIFAKYARYGFIIFTIIIVTIVLGPAFFNTWIYTGTGNANFFYFVTLGFLVGQIFLLLELLFVKLSHQYEQKPKRS